MSLFDDIMIMTDCAHPHGADALDSRLPCLHLEY